MLGLLFLLLTLNDASGAAHQRGVDLYKGKRYGEAIAVLEEAVKTEDPKTPQYSESVLLIGQSYFMLSQAPKAIPWLKKAPASNEADYMLGFAYLQTKQQDESEAAFARLFGLDPKSAAGHLLAGQMMLKQGYDAQAESEVTRAVALDQKLPEARFLLAEMAIFRGRLDEAIGDLDAELTVNPNFSMAWYRRGDAYFRQDKWNLAIADLQRAIWLNPDFSGPYILLGKCYFKVQNYANAEGILKRGLALDPKNLSAIYTLGQTLIAEGKQDEGRAMVEKLKELQQKK
jgi:tetratricopeptide (TPR) repeat protein